MNELKTALEKILADAKDLGQGAVDESKLPRLDFGYVVNVYETVGGLAVVAKFDKPIEINGEKGKRFGVGALRRLAFDVIRLEEN